MITSILFALFLGALTWTVLEYCIHRWLGHDRRFRPNPFAKEHIRHHIEGDYFAPASSKLGAAVVIVVVAGVPAVLLTGWFVGVAYVAGFVAFYAFYEVLHRLEHISAGFGPYGRWARRHHFSHHFTDARYNHGVTSPLWDLVFGTYRKVDLIKVPKRLAMQWLLDPETGEVWPELADHWELKGAAKRAKAREAAREESGNASNGEASVAAA